MGGPWEGLYRNASVIHDYFFDRRQYDSDGVHWVFYDAMLTSGVNPIKAKAMYYGVLRFNPRWEARYVSSPCAQIKPYSNVKCFPEPDPDKSNSLTEKIYQKVIPKFDQNELERVTTLIESKDLPLGEIERLAREQRGSNQ